MKVFLIKILLFFTIVAAIDICVGKAGDFFQSHAKGGDTRKTNDLVSKEQYDILIFGSSRASHHYDAPFLSETLGMDVFNAGYDGNGVVLSYGLLSLVLERYKPKLVIFDVEPSFDIIKYSADNGNKRYISTLKPYYKNVCVASIIKGVSEEEYYKNYSGMMRYNTTIISKTLAYIGGDDVSNMGYVPMNGVYTGEPEKKVRKTPEIDAYKLECFTKMLALAKSNNIPMMVVASPKYGEENSVDMRSIINICEKNQVPFVDYYADPVFMSHKEWFNEPMHLNAVGARVFSERIVKYINQFKQQ